MEFINFADARRKTNITYLGKINSNTKTIKNQKVSKNNTYIIMLAPANQSGYNVCQHSTPECRLGCLSTSGRVKMDIHNIIIPARIRRTKLFVEHYEFFMRWMVAEMKSAQRKSKKDGYSFSARLNGTSDIDWTEQRIDGKTIFEIFPDVQFYDYTKNPGMFLKDLPENYHLTFSYSGRNGKFVERVLNKKHNVAVVFDVNRNDKLPETWNGYKVVDGDLTDYRPNDGKGVIVGLRWKHIKDKEINEQIKNSVFVQRVNETILA